MPSDFDQVLDEQSRRRARTRYIREHAPKLHAALLSRQGDDAYDPCLPASALEAVHAAGLLFDALPPDPDAEDGSGAPAQEKTPPLRPPHAAPLLPVEAEITTRAACTCSGMQPCSAECRRCVPERRQSAGPAEVTHAGRPPLAKRLRALADCQQSQDPAVVAAYHAHLASSGLQDCGACGAQLDIAVVPDCRPSTAEEAGRLVRRIASAPIHSELAVQP